MSLRIIEPPCSVRHVEEDGVFRAHFIEDGRHRVAVIIGVFMVGDKLYWKIE